MATKLEIKQYAVNWLRLCPNRSEADTHAELRRQFLGEVPTDSTATTVAKTTVDGGFAFLHPVGFLFGLVLGMFVAIGRWFTGVNGEQTSDEIDAVMALLHEEGYWGDGRGPVGGDALPPS